MRFLPALTLSTAWVMVLAGCGVSAGGGGGSDGLADAVSADTAPYAILDLGSHAITWRTSIDASDASLRNERMAFRRVSVGSSQALVGVFEVTQAQWQRLWGSTPPGSWPWQDVPNGICATATAHGGDRPAYNLDQETVTSVISGLSLAGGARLAIPSSAQWTAACGTASGWWWGSSATTAQLAANAVVRESVISPARLSGGVDTGGPLSVGARAASPNGFYDLHGNVWEMLSDGTARGGSWRDSSTQSRSESLLGAAEGYHAELDHALVGARLVLIP
jgi:formylglycine-generating enzyme required for sulfatase activity